MKIEISAADSSREGIVRLFAEAMGFPDYHRPNWDSFDECLRDALEARSGETVDVRIEPVPGDDAAFTLIDILNDCRAEYGNLTFLVRETPVLASGPEQSKRKA